MIIYSSSSFISNMFTFSVSFDEHYLVKNAKFAFQIMRFLVPKKYAVLFLGDISI